MVYVSWRVSGAPRAVCHVWPDQAPMLELSDGQGFTLSVTSSTTDEVSAEHGAFARELAVAVRRYWDECARWAGPWNG